MSDFNINIAIDQQVSQTMRDHAIRRRLEDAAPDLYAACEAALPLVLIWEDADGDHAWELIRQLKAALAKALPPEPIRSLDTSTSQVTPDEPPMEMATMHFGVRPDDDRPDQHAARNRKAMDVRGNAEDQTAEYADQFE